MKIAIGCDHAGFAIKNLIIEHIKNKGYEVVDVGTNSADSCHYPIYAHALCEKIQSGECALGILICGTGIGMSMCANKHKGIRAALCSDTYSAKMTRVHNDANLLCMGARVIGSCLAIDILDAFLGAEFEGGRHAIRVDMMMDIENK